MRKTVLLFLLVVLVFALLSPVYAQSPVIHIVREGETLTSIAQQYGVSVEAIIAANHLSDPDTLTIGTRLIIPITGPANNSQPTAPRSAPGTYTVQPGDTLTSIANQFGISVDQLIAANKISDPSVIQVGKVLKIPGQSVDTPSQPVVTVPDGQYTYSPAKNAPVVVAEVSGGRLVSVILQANSSGKQGFPLSCEAKIASQLAMMYGLNFDEVAFMDRLPHSLNPQRGFVGSVSGRFYWPGDIIGGNANGPGGYGVHVEGWLPTFKALSGFQARLLSSTQAGAQSQIDGALRHGYPVAVWANLNFRPPLDRNSVWIGASADGTAIDCGGPAPNCYYLSSGEHAYLILGRREDEYIVYDPGSGDFKNVATSIVITGITTFFAVPTGSAPGAVIIPLAGDTPDLTNLPNW